jgi:tetratricopeptide (TPR) repeat protein
MAAGVAATMMWQGSRDTAELSASPVAYGLYMKGIDASANMRSRDAVTWLAQAVAADPAFAEAHLRLALAYANVGDMTGREAALRNASAHASKLSERNRLLLAVLLASGRDGDPRRRAELLDEMLTRYPDVDEAYPIATALYDPVSGPLPDLQKHLAIARAGAMLLPESAQTRNNYGYALSNAGRFEEAAHEFSEYARLSPREPNPFDSLGSAYVLLGAPAKAVEAYSRALAIDPGFEPSRDGLAYSYGMLGRFDDAVAANPSIAHLKAILLARVGRYAEAGETVRQGLARAEPSRNMLIAAGLRIVSASLALERGQYEAALREVEVARRPLGAAPPSFARLMSFIADTLAGVANIRLGRLRPAEALAELQSRTRDAGSPVHTFWHSVLNGELALAHGDPVAAATAFAAGELPKRGISLGVPGSVLTNNWYLRDGIARAARARGDRPGAIQQYRRLLANGPDLKLSSLLEPRYVLELARLLDENGDRTAARIEYRRFLDFWTHADAQLPELAEARVALASR